MKTLWSSSLAALALLFTGVCAPAAIKTEDDEAEFPVAGEIPVKNWAKLMEETNTKPIVIPPTSKSVAEGYAKSWAWTNGKLLQPALDAYAAPGDQELRDFWQKATHLWQDNGRLVPEPSVTERLAKLAQDPKLPPGLCLIAGRLLQRAPAYEKAGLALLPRVVDAPEGTPMPPFFRLAAATHLLQDELRHPERRNRKPVEEKFFKVFADSIAKPLPPDDVEQTTISYLQGGIHELERGREARYIGLYQHSALPEWLRLMLEGAIRRNWSYSIEVSDAPDPKEMSRQEATARTLCTQAWKLHPDSVYPPYEMLALAQQENKRAEWQFNPKEKDELRLWFDRAIAVQCDWMPVYGSALNGYSPDYGGNFPKMLAFGRACAETRRFDTNVPTVFSDALSRIADNLPDWRTLYRQPGISKLLLETDRQRVAHLERHEDQPSVRTQLAFDAWACAEYALAAEHFLKLKRDDGTVPSVTFGMTQAVRWQVDLGFVLGDSLSRGGADKEAYEEAGRLLAGDLAPQAAEAEKIYRRLLGRADPAARPLLQANVRLAEFRQTFAKGEWAPLPLDEAQCWRELWGKGDWQANTKRLRLITPSQFSKLLFRGRLGPRFELRGHFYNSHGIDRQAGGLGILCGHTPMGAGGNGMNRWWTTRVDNTDKTHNAVDYGMTFGESGNGNKEFPWQADNSFVYRYDKGKVTFSVNDKEFLREVELSGPDAFTGSGAVGFSMLGQGSGAVTELWEVEARKLFNAL